MSKLQMTMEQKGLSHYVASQLDRFFPDEHKVDPLEIVEILGETLEWVKDCFAVVRNKYFQSEGAACFDPLHTDQYAMFLYMLSRLAFLKKHSPALCRKIYALNKALHALDVYYEVELPRYFLFTHPLGTVLGRARYGNYLSVYQGVTVGSNLEGVFPELEEGVVLYGRSTVVGRSRIGSNSWISVGTTIREEITAADQIVFGETPHLGFRPTRRRVREHYFHL